MILVLLLATCILESNAQEKKDFNPADPTQAATSLVLMPEFDKSDEYKAYGTRLTFDRDWAEGKYSINVEIPYAKVDFNDGGSETGLADIRTRIFIKIYEKEDAKLQNMIFNLDVFLPTGNAEEGFGSGTFMLVPGIIFNFPVSERFSIFPNPRFQFTTGKTLSRSSAFYPGKISQKPRLESEEYIFAFEVETFFVYQFKKAFWAFAAPNINWDFLPEPDEDNYEMILKGQVGKMFGKFGTGLEGTTFIAGEKSQDYQLRMLFYYFF